MRKDYYHKIPLLLIGMITLIALNIYDNTMYHITIDIFIIISSLLAFNVARMSITIKQDSIFISMTPILLLSVLIVFYHAMSFPSIGIFHIDEGLTERLLLIYNYMFAFPMIYIILFHKRGINIKWLYIILTIFMLVLLSLAFSGYFPSTYVVEQGPTIFRVVNEITFSIIYLGLLIYVILSRKSNNISDTLEISLFLTFMFLSSVLYISFKTEDHITYVFGHMFRLIAIFFIFDTVNTKYVNTPLHKVFIELNAELEKEKKVSAHIRKSESIFKSLYENAPVGYQSLNEEGYIIHANEAYADLLGYTKDEMIGMWFGELLNLEGKKTFGTNFDIFKNEGKTTIIIQMLHKDGRVIPVKFIGRIARNLDGSFSRTHCILMDITHDLEYQDSLIKNEQELYSILDSTLEGVYGEDVQGICTFINQTALNLLGYEEPSDFIGKNMHQLIHHSYEDGNPYPKEDCPTHNVIKTGKAVTINDEVFFRKDGSKMDVEYKVYPQFNNKEIIGSVVTFTNISERNRIVETLVQISYQDTLTGLYNRRYYEKELKNIDYPYNLPIALILCDINGLKLVNDAFGHNAGDELLIDSSKVFKNIVKNKGLVARIGGDEFIIVLSKTSKKEADELVMEIGKESTKYEVNSIPLSISMGVSVKEMKSQDIYEIYKNAEDNMYREKLHRIPSMRSDAITTILKTLNEKDTYSEMHSRQVSKLSKNIASLMGLQKQKIQEISTAALLHDIGKIILPSSILNKKTKLTNSEYEEIKKHSEIGYRILYSSPNMRIISDFVLNHHERYDGKGYPRGIKGEDIPFESRIICIADSFDAMTSDRIYKDKLSFNQAVEELRKNAGTQFDPNIIELILNNIDILKM